MTARFFRIPFFHLDPSVRKDDIIFQPDYSLKEPFTRHRFDIFLFLLMKCANISSEVRLNRFILGQTFEKCQNLDFSFPIFI